MDFWDTVLRGACYREFRNCTHNRTHDVFKCFLTNIFNNNLNLYLECLFSLPLLRITEALLKADDYLLIRGNKGWANVHFFVLLFMFSLLCSNVKMSEAIHDPYAYTRLTDNVFQQILASEGDNLKEVG